MPQSNSMRKQSNSISPQVPAARKKRVLGLQGGKSNSISPTAGAAKSKDSNDPVWVVTGLAVV